MNAPLDMLLINVGGSRKRVYQGLSAGFAAVEPPFWCALTAGFLRKHGHAVDILDANFLNLDPDEAAAAALQRQARINVIVVYSQQANTCTPIMNAVGRLCRAIKQRDPEAQVVLTGWHPSALPERTLREEACDMVAQGEGFYTLQGLAEGRALDQIPGLWWKQNGDVSHNPRPANIDDLDETLSDVAWDLLPLGSGNYRAFNWMCLQSLDTRNHYASLFTSLGCPYHCSFCAIHATFHERRIRNWSPEWTLRQCETLAREYGVKHINLIDELFVFDRRHFLPIAEGLVERNLGLNFCAFARVDSVDRTSDEELKLLKKAGFNWIKLGIESVDPEVLRRAKKGKYVREVVRRVVGRLHDAGIDLCANFMFGLPGDTMQSMQENLDFAQELNCAFPSFFCAMAPPGSDLYEDALREGIPLPETWEGYAQQGYNFLPLPTEQLTAAEVLRFRDEAFDKYFTDPRYLEMIRAKFGPAAVEHIQQMTRVRLKRRLLGD